MNIMLKTIERFCLICKYVFADLIAVLQYYHLCDNKKFDKDILIARIMMQTHRIEKGLSIQNLRSGFGYAKICDIIHHLNNYESSGYDISHPSIAMAVDTISAYLNYHNKIEFENSNILDIKQKISIWQTKIPKTDIPSGGTLLIKRKDLSFPVEEIEQFFLSRHSVRAFSDEPVSHETIEKAVELASRYPSACNRQPTRVHVVDKDLLVKSGYSSGYNLNEAYDKFLIVTSKLSAFQIFDNFQYIVSSSIFIGYLSLTLHLYGIGGCVLKQPVLYSKKSRKKAECIGLPKDEQLIAMIGIGMLKDEFNVPVSNRLNCEHIISYFSETVKKGEDK